jgi:hypothetical protein
MNRATRAIVLVSTVAAALVGLYLATYLQQRSVFYTLLAAFAALAVAGHLLRGVVTPLVMFAMYLSPAAWVYFAGYEDEVLEVVWVLPLLAVIVAGRNARRWSLPSSWRWPLVAWALIVSAVWPIVVLRELDFALWILPVRGVANTSIGITPWDAALNVTYFTLGHNVGLLWIDALFRWYAKERPQLFTMQVLLPMAAGAAIACLVGVYQGVVDVHFLTAHLWGYMRRAAGTLADANAFGVIAAMWGPGFVVLARGLPAPWSVVAGGTGMAMALAAVWMSGSRTGLAAILVGLAAIAYAGWRRWQAAPGRRQPLSRLALPLAAAIAVLIAFGFAMSRISSTTTVLGRGSLGFIPGLGDLGVRESARQLLWERFGYGPAAVSMIGEHALSGVGVGSFHTLVHDYGTLSGYDIVPDNAQSWFRHLFAEFGGLGSLPWIWWCVVFGAVLFSRRASGDRVTVDILRGPLLALGLASLFGMPGQSTPVILTFWTFVFWFVFAGRFPLVEREAGRQSRPWSGATWALTFLLVATHAGLTFADARGDLLPRNRARRFDWNYRYGITDAERSPDANPGRMWTDRRSLSVIPVKGKVLKFVAWIDHPDADERPVRVRVTVDSVVVHDSDLKRSAAIMLDIPAPAGASHMVIETEISRTWRPADFGRNDRRELGLSVRDWTWE